MPPKKVKAIVKVQAIAGKATPAPPIGTALGPQGINIGDFVQQFNARTKDMGDLTIPAVITIFEDRSFTFITKTPPTAVLIKKALGLASGSGEPNRTKVGKITMAQIEEIAKTKLVDLNTTDLEAAKRVVMGTCRSMGVDVA